MGKAGKSQQNPSSLQLLGPLASSTGNFICWVPKCTSRVHEPQRSIQVLCREALVCEEHPRTNKS